MKKDRETGLEDRLRADTYEGDAEVHFGLAQRGKEPDKWLGFSERLVARLTNLGEAYELQQVPTIDIYADTVFNSQQCESLYSELRFLNQIVSDPVLDEVTAALSALAKAGLRGSLRLIVSGN